MLVLILFWYIYKHNIYLLKDVKMVLNISCLMFGWYWMLKVWESMTERDRSRNQCWFCWRTKHLCKSWTLQHTKEDHKLWHSKECLRNSKKIWDPLNHNLRLSKQIPSLKWTAKSTWKWINGSENSFQTWGTLWVAGTLHQSRWECRGALVAVSGADVFWGLKPEKICIWPIVYIYMHTY